MKEDYKHEITKEFIDWLRSDLADTEWSFDDEEAPQIVPDNLTHTYLYRNFTVDDSINRYYHLPTSNLLTDDEYKKLVKTGFVGDIKISLSPYSFVAYGAYHNRRVLYYKLFILTQKNRPYLIGEKEVQYFEDLKPYFKQYANGFKDGFERFDETQIKPFLTPLADKQDYVNKVFEFITKQIPFTHDYTRHFGSFVTNGISNEIVNAYEDGQKQGFFYRAWSIVFSNNDLFAPRFQYLFDAEKSTLPTNRLEQEISQYLMIQETKEYIVTPDNIKMYAHLDKREGETVKATTLRCYKDKNDLPVVYAARLHEYLKKTDATETLFRETEIDKINDWIKKLKTTNIDSDFIPPLKFYKELIEAKTNADEDKATINPLDFIRPELYSELSKLEKKITFDGNRIKCAAFCELLKDYSYFTDVKNTASINNAIIKSFALSRYKIDIKNQVLSAKKDERETTKNRLRYLFK